LTAPLPEPLPPDVTPIHESLLTAFQAQPAGAVTDELPFPPVEPNDAVAGEIEKVHEGVAPP
jgi:hypothetical protein